MSRSLERWSELKGRQIEPEQPKLFPAYVVWELTLSCDHACLHCGSRAAVSRQQELSPEEALLIVPQLAELGTREVVLIGGEAYLSPVFLPLVSALAEAGITPVMTTGGWDMTPERARTMAQAGMKRVSVSLDGLEKAHQQIRQRRDSFKHALRAMTAIGDAGMDISANTHFNRLNQADLEGLYTLLKMQGVRSWQIQITAALGRAADQPEMLFQPWDLLDFMPRVAALKQRGLTENLLIMPGNNLGYFGPEEALLRSPLPGGQDFFQGCQAGKFVLGIESNGDVKGCPSLPSLPYVGGNLRNHSLRDIWEKAAALAFRRNPSPLWGFCATCPFAEVCKGGCNFTAHALLGRPGNNPYCHFRARNLANKGRRERLLRIAPAQGNPFDHGLFELIEEEFNPSERYHSASP